MAEKPEIIDESGDKYKYGFVTDINSETAPKGLNEEIIRLISNKKGSPTDFYSIWYRGASVNARTKS